MSSTRIPITARSRRVPARKTSIRSGMAPCPPVFATASPSLDSQRSTSVPAEFFRRTPVTSRMSLKGRSSSTSGRTAAAITMESKETLASRSVSVPSDSVSTESSTTCRTAAASAAARAAIARPEATTLTPTCGRRLVSSSVPTLALSLEPPLPVSPPGRRMRSGTRWDRTSGHSRA